MRLPQQWLSVLSVNSIFLLNLGFPLLTLPPTLHRGEVIAQTDPNVEALRLYRQGVELFDQGTAESKKQAIVVWEKALQLYQQAGNKAREAGTLVWIGFVYNALGDKQRAIDFYNQSLLLRRQEGNKAGEAATLTGICSCLQTRTPMLACQDNFLLTLGVLATFDALDRGASFYTIAIASRILCDRSLPQCSFKQGRTFERRLGDK